MAGMIPNEVIEQVRAHLEIVDVVQSYVQLKRSGRNYLGLCPFHSEKSPSFSVSPDKQLYHCFGCGKGGDAFRFVMEIEQLTFGEAVRHLADRIGISVPEIDVADSEQEDERQQMRNALKLAAQLFHHVLLHTPQGEQARAYLHQRQVTMETIEAFQIGFAPPSYDFLLNFLKRRNFTEPLLEKAGLIVSRTPQQFFDRFRDRVMFPIHDAQGRIVGFGGRTLGEGKPKYLNSPETILFHKGHHLFNLHRARSEIRKEQSAVLFEGYMDVITAWQAGIHTVVATLGTALTDDQAKVLKRNTESVTLCYDADPAGQNAATKGLETLRQQDCRVKVAQMPVGLDPDDYIRRQGAMSFKEEILAGALSYTAFKLESLKKHYNLQDTDERMRYLAEALEVITALPLAIEQDHYLRKLAEEFQLSLDAMKEEQRKVKNSKKKPTNRDKEEAKWNNGYREVNRRLLGEVLKVPEPEKSEMLLVAHMMRDSSVAEWVKQNLGADFPTEMYAVLAAYLYSYYEQGNPEDIGRFIQTLPDSSFIDKASELAMLELPEQATEEALRAYVRHIRNDPILKEIEKKEKMIEQLSFAGEPVKAAQLLVEVTKLRKEL